MSRGISAAAGFGALALALVAAGGSTGCESEPQPTRLHGQVHLTLLHTADLHSRLFPYNLQLGQVDAGLGLGEALSITNVGGAARISHIIGRERARSSRVLHLDGGDCFQGAPIFNFYNGEAEIRTLSAMGADAMVVANHEFDKGAQNLGIQLQNFATFPVLAANYLFEDPAEPGASPLGTVIQPFSTFMVDGLRVAVVGMGNLSTVTSIYESPNRLGITPLTTVEVAQFYVDLLRPTVDAIVFVTHLGLEYDQRMIERTTGIDVVLGGHNHIVLQPPKRVQDCSEHFDEAAQSWYIELNSPHAEDGDGCEGDNDCQSGYCNFQVREDGKRYCKVKRYCEPRDVVLAHSGAFAKYVGRLDLILSNDPNDFPETCQDAAGNPRRCYDPLNGFEVLSNDFQLFPVNETVPSDPIVATTLEPYAQGLDVLANLDLLVGYALDGSRRFSTTGGDSPLGNMIATAMWLRLGIQTDFSLTNTTGIRADLVPGPVTVEQMFNIFPFDNSISKMQLSGVEVKQLFDFVARRSAGRGCVSQAQIAGARVVIDCSKQAEGGPPGVATDIYIGVPVDDDGNPLPCKSDADCPGQGVGSCDVEAEVCWQRIDDIAYYELATSNYLAQGGSGFRVLQRNTTQFDTQVQQRDALIDYIRAGTPCGGNPDSDCIEDGGACQENDDCCTRICQGQSCTGCSADADCGHIGEGYVCACPDAVTEGAQCQTEASGCSGGGKCVLGRCRDDVAAFLRETCQSAVSNAVRQDCLNSVAPCMSAGEQCKFLACVDRRIGNFSDGRLKMIGQ